jgi:hypothetical protein
LLEVITPATFLTERGYILDLLLNEWLGVPFQHIPTDQAREVIISDGQSTLTLADVFFAMPSDAWLKPASMPAHPLEYWQSAGLLENDLPLPVVFGARREGAFLSESGDYLGIDVFGSAFFLLTRYEEMILTERDPYGRIASSRTTAGRNGFVMRPLVNEYLELMWKLLSRRFPGLNRKDRDYRFFLSFDVDQPFAGAYRPVLSVARSLVSDFRKRRPVGMLADRARAWLTSDVRTDPCNTFEWLMDAVERHQVQSAFYFIADHTGGRIDGDYSLDDPAIQTLMSRIDQRGHEIGLHTSFHTYNDSGQTLHEADRLRKACHSLGIEQKIHGGRQHWLRWEPSVTWQNWEDAGMEYDSSVCFYDSVGFRASTCYEYPAYNLLTRKRLSLRERPLIAMDATLYDDMDVRENESKKGAALILPLHDLCRFYRGDFTFLWHNHNLRFAQQRQLFTTVLEAAARSA